MKFVNFIFFLLLLQISAVSRAEEVIYYSASSQGNGYNWASTLGWISEGLKQTALYALKEEQATGKKMKIAILSLSGGSSSAAVSVLLDTALSNPSINSNPSSRLLTPEETLKLANVISVISRGSDYDIFTLVGTMFRVLSEQVKVKLYRLVEKIPLLRNFFFDGVLKVNNHIITRKIVISDFGRFLYFAKNVPYELLEKPLASMEGFEKFQKLSETDPQLKQVIAELQVLADSPLQSIPDFEKVAEVNEQVVKLLDWQKGKIREMIDSTVKKGVGSFGDIFRRFGNSMDPFELTHSQKTEKDLNSFQSILNEKPGDGVMTSALVKDFENLSAYKQYLEINKKINYDNLKLYIFMNKETALKILKSQQYQSELMKSNSVLRRYVIAVIDQRWTALNNSIQEPNLFEDLYGELHSDKLRIRYLYDPSLDNDNEFRLTSTLNEKLKKRVAFVVGGFAYQPILSLMQGYYNRALLDKKASKYYFHFTFEKDQDPRDKDQFSISLLEKQLKPNDLEDASKNIDDYVEWYEKAKTLEDRVDNGLKKFLIRTKMDWNIHKLPAQLINLGHLLFLKGKKALIHSYEVRMEKALAAKFRSEEKHEIISEFSLRTKNVSQCLKFYQR